MIPAGSYDLQVFADGDDPASADLAIEAMGVEVLAGANATVVAHLDADGNPQLTPFVNDLLDRPGEARLTVRHTAAAPAVDVRADGSVVFGDVMQPDEGTADVPAGTYSADVVLAGTEDVVLGPADLDLTEGTNTIVYAGQRRGQQPRVRRPDHRRAAPAPGGVPGAGGAGCGVRRLPGMGAPARSGLAVALSLRFAVLGFRNAPLTCTTEAP